MEIIIYENKIIDGEIDELIIKEFKSQLEIHKSLKEKGNQIEEFELDITFFFVDYVTNVYINAFINFLKNDEFKTYDFYSLKLTGNSINFEELSLILPYLNTNPFITKLDLSGNSCGHYQDKFGQEIFDYFSVNTTLKVLDLSLNYIGNIDRCNHCGNECNYDNENTKDEENYNIMYIMNGIKSNPHTALIEIDLSYNNIDKSCMYSIARMLETNTSLKKLDLSNNILSRGLYDEISPTSLEILGKSLLLNQTLCHLDISISCCLIEEYERFGSIIQNNYTLLFVNYQKPHIIKIDILDDFCARNQKLIKSKEKFMNFILTIRKQQKKRLFLVELYDLIFSEFILTF